MAQTILCARLLLKGETAGYELHKDGKIYHIPWSRELYSIPIKSMFNYRSKSIKHDSFELGIELKGIWWFENDAIIGDTTYYKEKKSVVYRREDGAFWAKAIDKYVMWWDMPLTHLLRIEGVNWKNIGTIRNSKKDGK